MAPSADNLNYLSGFANHFLSEAEDGAVPRGQNSPQKVKYGLYAEQLSGTSFVMPRHQNLRSWLYRVRPSVLHSSFSEITSGNMRSRPFNEIAVPPDQYRWNAFDLPIDGEKIDFVDSLFTIAGNGESASVRGSAIHLYGANHDMHRYFYNSDGDFLIVPQQGSLFIATEFGALNVKPGEIAVIPRGIKYQVSLPDKTARGYILENYGAPFRLPDLGPIGSNGLANARDFLAPAARYEIIEKDKKAPLKLVNKFNGRLWQADIHHSPLDVVGWHGNYYPYKYDLALFNTVNTVSFDHPDPSIFTVLTSPSEMPGTANVDFVIFPPRWMVAENTFRPPYYHRNTMSEYMGLIYGVYDAKQTGFVPGGGSLHNAFSAHGPDLDTFNKASQADLKPQYLGNTLAFMFESSLIYAPTALALTSRHLQKDYLSCWAGLSSNFSLNQS